MLIRNVSQSQVTAIVAQVSAQYGDNITTHQDMHEDGVRVKRVTGRIRAESSRGPGARKSWSGRRTVSACWHAHRDFYRALFAAYPNATVKTMLANYTSQNFEDTYRATGNQNIGSLFAPAYMPELCECEH